MDDPIDVFYSLGVEEIEVDGQVLSLPSRKRAQAPLYGFGDEVSRGDVVRVYRRDRKGESLDVTDGVVHDYDPDGSWMLVTFPLGQPRYDPTSGPTSFHLSGPGWSRRLEVVSTAKSRQ